MTINRRGLHEEISRLDKEIEQANHDKAEYFKAYREQLAERGFPKDAIKLEIDAFKKAERKLRALAKDAEGEIERDDLVDEIVCELQEPVGTKVALARASRTRETKKGPSGDAGHASRSAPVAADGDHGDGESAVTTNSDALAINPPAPSHTDSDAAAGVAPSVASAAPIPESEPVALRGSDLGRLDAAGNTALSAGSPPIPESAATSSAPAASLDSVPTLCGAAPIFDGDIRGSFLDRSLWV